MAARPPARPAELDGEELRMAAAEGMHDAVGRDRVGDE